MYSFFIHSYVAGRLGCVRVLAIVNSAAMNTGLHVSFSVMVFSEHMPSSGIIGSHGGFTLSFLRNFHLVLHSVYQFTFPPTVQEGSHFSTPSPAFIVCRFLFDNGHSNWCEVVPHRSFDLHFSNNEQC